MNAIIAFLIWAVSLFGSPSIAPEKGGFEGKIRFQNQDNNISVNGVHIMNGNPRTVVALEDTHFRPM